MSIMKSILYGDSTIIATSKYGKIFLFLILSQRSLPMHQNQKKRNLIAERMMVRHAHQMEDSLVVVGYNRVACSLLLPENNL